MRHTIKKLDKYTSVFIACIFLLIANLVFVQNNRAETEKKPLTLEESILIALKNNPTLLAAQAKINKAQAAISEAKSKLYPNVSANLYGAQAFINSNTIINTNILVNQPLFQGGKLKALYEQAKANYLTEEAEFLKTKRKIITDVKKAYYTLFTSDELRKIQQDKRGQTPFPLLFRWSPLTQTLQ